MLSLRYFYVTLQNRRNKHNHTGKMAALDTDRFSTMC